MIIKSKQIGSLLTLPQNITPSQTNYYHTYTKTLLTNFTFIPNKTNTKLYLHNIISNYQLLITLPQNTSHKPQFEIYLNNTYFNTFTSFYSLLNFFTNPNTSHHFNPTYLTNSQQNLLSQLTTPQPSNILSLEKSLTHNNTFELQNYTKNYSLTINISQNSQNFTITKYNSKNSHYLPISQTFPNLSQTIQHYSTLIS